MKRCDFNNRLRNSLTHKLRNMENARFYFGIRDRLFERLALRLSREIRP